MARLQQGTLRASSSAEHADSRYHNQMPQKSPNRCVSISQSNSNGSNGRQGTTQVPAWRQGRLMKRMESSLFPLVGFSCVCVLLFARASDHLHFGKSRRATGKWTAELGLVEDEERLLSVAGTLSRPQQYNRISLGSQPPVEFKSAAANVAGGSREGSQSKTGKEEEQRLVNNDDVIQKQLKLDSGYIQKKDPLGRSILASVDDAENQKVLQEPRSTSLPQGTKPEAAALAPLPGVGPSQGPCETQSERNARLVRNNVRKAMRTIPLPILSRKASQALGVPCSPSWRTNVWNYFKQRKWTRRTAPSVKQGIEQVCKQIKGMVNDIKLADEEDPGLPLCPGDAPRVPQRVQADNETGEEETGAESRHDWGHCWPNQQPFSPRVQRHLADLIRTSHTNASRRARFGGIQWKFLVMSYTVEQLSKGKIHLTEAARLARYSNRILVLPRASNSRLSLARPFPVCNYLSLEPLVEHGVDWISPDMYLLLMSHFVPRRPTAAFMCLETKSLWRPCAGYSEIAKITEQIMAYSYWDQPTWKSMQTFDLPWTPSISPAQSQTALNTWEDKDVVVYMKTTPALIGFARPGSIILADSMFPYAAHLHAKVDRLVERLGWPFVALHFRSEFVVFTLGSMNKSDLIIDQMKGCSHQAALMALRVASQIGAKSIFIAADIPWTPASSNNSDANSTGPVKAQRSESWATMEKQFGRSRSLDIAEASLRYLRSRIPGSFMLDELDPSVNNMDPGEVSILDKLICAHADSFLAGVKMCGGMRAYDADIMRQRGALHKSSASVFRWTSTDPK